MNVKESRRVVSNGRQETAKFQRDTGHQHLDLHTEFPVQSVENRREDFLCSHDKFSSFFVCPFFRLTSCDRLPITGVQISLGTSSQEDFLPLPSMTQSVYLLEVLFSNDGTPLNLARSFHVVPFPTTNRRHTPSLIGCPRSAFE